MKRPLIDTLLTIADDDTLVALYYQVEGVARDSLIEENAVVWQSDDVNGLKDKIYDQLKFRSATFKLKESQRK